MGNARGLAFVLCLCLFALALACGPGVAFECEARSDCQHGREQGVCEAGYCAFVDGHCPSQHRWGEHAPEDIAGECVPWDSTAADSSTPMGEKGAIDGDTDDAGDDAPDPDDGAQTSGSDGAEPEPGPDSPEPAWVCTVDPIHLIDAANGTFGGWTPGYTGPAPTWVVMAEGLHLHLPTSGPSSAYFVRELTEGDEVIVASGLQLGGADAYSWLEVVTDVPYRIERDGTELRLVDGQNPGIVSVLDPPVDPSAWNHLRIVLSRDAIHYEASPDGIAFTELSSHPRQSDAPPTSVAIGLTRETESTASADLLVHAVSRCAPA